MRYQNYVWDFDGTLFDTYPHMVSSMRGALINMDVEVPWEEVYQHMKRSVPETIAKYSEMYGLDAEALANLYLQIRRDDPVAEQELYPGALMLLRAIREQGGRHFILTHRGFTARQILERLEMTELFDEVITASDGYPRKPDPTALRYLLEKHGLVPEETVMIGDRMLDIETGRNAGIEGILFDPDHYYDGEKVGETVDSMADLAVVLEVGIMSFYDLAAERFSVRKFLPDPVEREKTERILECGRLAPTAKNIQPQKIYILESEWAREVAKEVSPCTFDAPLLLMICADVNQAWVNPDTGHSSAEMDISIVTTHMMMAAEELGLGSTWVCRFDTERAKELFALPEGIQPYCLLPIGYPAEDAIPSPNHLLRKPLEETVEII